MRDLHLDLEFDLDNDLDNGRGLGRRAALEHSLRRAVQSGRLKSGERLPSTRTMAEDLGLSRSTVVAAYEQLVVEGYLHSVVGSGTTVADLTTAPDEPRPPPAVDQLAHDFRPGQGDGSLFPRTQWLKSVKRALATCPDDVFGYTEPSGRIELRRALAGYLGRSRAVVAGPRNLSVFNGATSAVSFLGELLGHRGHDVWAMEDPSLFLLRAALTSVGVRLRPVPIDDEGIEIEALARSGARVVMVTPAHQYPMGVTMTARRRTQLIEWARDVDGWIIEDDYDGEFRYDRRPVGSLQGLDPERVIYLGTASKSLAAGLRLGWLVVPASLSSQLDRLKHVRGGSSVLDQLTFADFVSEGHFDRHLRRTRTIYRHRRTELISALSDLDWLELGSHSAGLHVVARFLDGRSESDLIRSGRPHGVGLFGLGPHWLDEPTATGLVLGYSRPPEHGFANSLQQLAEFLRSR